MTTQDNAVLPARQMESIKVDNLLINFTTEFQRIQDTAAIPSQRASFWRPIPAPDLLHGYFSLGDIALRDHDNPNGTMVTPVVCEGEHTGSEKTKGHALNRPVDFELIWRNSASAVATRLYIWRPIAPIGYVALGTVCTNDNTKPSFNSLRCVREDLVTEAGIGEQIWNDKGSRVKLNCSVWSIAPPFGIIGEICLTSGSFIADQSHQVPASHHKAYALRVPIAVEVSTPAEAPTLTTSSGPVSDGAKKITQVARLPWFAVTDQLQPTEQFQQTPFYQLRRTDQYMLVGSTRNDTEHSLPVKWIANPAHNRHEMLLFSDVSSIRVHSTWPAKVPTDHRVIRFRACLPDSFNYTERTSTGWLDPQSVVVLAMAAKGKSMAVYRMQSHYELLRADGTKIASDLHYADNDSLYLTEFPAQSEETEQECPLPLTASSAQAATVDVDMTVEPAPELPVVTDSAP
ncbi:Vps62-related protein [Pseudomonas fluorescens]|uniref:Vps62-related protein n=1 Tax=Pseudomonas fluorescens TaxID=294 RepID=UPI0012418471|nr:Vps62-related protein [Pseudomonas fluorescens]VVP15240.1 hypothetical protein PS898_03535 [Pseudomonas fluorescens]